MKLLLTLFLTLQANAVIMPVAYDTNAYVFKKDYEDMFKDHEITKLSLLKKTKAVKTTNNIVYDCRDLEAIYLEDFCPNSDRNERFNPNSIKSTITETTPNVPNIPDVVDHNPPTQEPPVVEPPVVDNPGGHGDNGNPNPNNPDVGNHDPHDNGNNDNNSNGHGNTGHGDNGNNNNPNNPNVGDHDPHNNGKGPK